MSFKELIADGGVRKGSGKGYGCAVELRVVVGPVMGGISSVHQRGQQSPHWSIHGVGSYMVLGLDSGFRLLVPGDRVYRHLCIRAL